MEILSSFGLQSLGLVLAVLVGILVLLFVVSRVAGWSAHVIEQLGNNRLIRPRSHYIGQGSRPFVRLAERG